MTSIFISKPRISQPFGVNADYYKKTDGHEGIDLVPANKIDFGVHIPKGFNGGQVVYDGDVPGVIYGRQVKVWFPKLFLIMQFCHLSENTINKGQLLNEGDFIGVMGDSGNSHGCHVHFNIMPVDKNGKLLNSDPKEAYIDPTFVLDDPYYCVNKINGGKR